MTIQRLLTRLVTFILLCVLFTQTAFSQNKTITGKILDDKGAPVQGATVSVKGQKAATSTAADGTFRLAIPAGGTDIVVSSVGFTPQTLSIGTQETMNVSLVPSTLGLNEVVVVGYQAVRKKDVTGSVTSVTAKDFNQGAITSPDQLLQNKVAGLEIVNNNGAPGAGTTVKIRGSSSLRASNNPLYVIDGVALDGRTAKPDLDLGRNGLPFGSTPESNPLLYINPADIQQIDVLKDASATAIYGSRGANGIIIITTKKGTGGALKVDAGVNFGFNAGYMKSYGLLTASEFRDLSLKNNLKQDSGATVNPLKDITRTGFSQNYSLGISGGGDNGKWRASFLGSRVDGFVKKTGLDKYLGNFGGSYKFIDNRVSLDFDLIAGHTTENMGLFTNSAGAGGSLMSWTLNWNPTVRYKNSDGTWNNTPNSSFGIPNPLAVIDAYNDVADVNVFLANISAGVRIVKGLDYKFLYAINHGAGTRNTNFEGWIAGVQGISGSGLGAISQAQLTSQTFTHTLNYHTDLTEALKFDIIGGYEYFKTNYFTSTLSAQGFNTNELQTARTPIKYTNFMDNASTTNPLFQAIDPTAELQSFFGRVNFNLSDKYYLTATVRDDGSNKFGINNKYGLFPSVGAKWQINEEEFLKSSSAVNNLALRASWGITGNQEFPSGASQAQYNSPVYNSAGQINVFNPDLKWEKATTIDLGLDYGFLANRVYGSIDYYRKSTTNILFQGTAIQPAPASIYFINLPDAKLVNQGVEFTVGAAIVQGKKFSWDASFNISYNSNKLTEFNQALIQTGAVSGNGVSGVFAEAFTNNQTLNVYYLKPFQGYDKSGNQIVDSANKGPVFAGNPNPHVVLGFSTTLRYGKMSLAINAGGSFGFLIYNNTYNTITNIAPFSKGQNAAKSNFGTGENISDGAVASTRYLESGNYLKLRNARFSYAFGNLGQYLKNVNAFVAGSNLFEITKFHGFDAEVNVDKNNMNYPSQSMEYLPYPTPRVITIGVNFGL